MAMFSWIYCYSQFCIFSKNSWKLFEVNTQGIAILSFLPDDSNKYDLALPIDQGLV